MSTATEETPDYKKIAELTRPEKHLCIKCKQRIARLGIVCDDCLAPIVI
jgi:predicted amidophosphoribosyltransferase